jgi:lysyl endopeptidase
VGDTFWAGMCETPHPLSGVRIYPNPVTTSLTIDNIYNEDLSIRIADITGKTLHEERMASGRQALDMQAYPDGIYFVRLTSKEETLSKKIIVNKK